MKQHIMWFMVQFFSHLILFKICHVVQNVTWVLKERCAGSDLETDFSSQKDAWLIFLAYQLVSLVCRGPTYRLNSDLVLKNMLGEIVGNQAIYPA